MKEVLAKNTSTSDSKPLTPQSPPKLIQPSSPRRPPVGSTGALPDSPKKTLISTAIFNTGISFPTMAQEKENQLLLTSAIFSNIVVISEKTNNSPAPARTTIQPPSPVQLASQHSSDKEKSEEDESIPSAPHSTPEEPGQNFVELLPPSSSSQKTKRSFTEIDITTEPEEVFPVPGAITTETESSDDNISGQHKRTRFDTEILDLESPTLIAAFSSAAKDIPIHVPSGNVSNINPESSLPQSSSTSTLQSQAALPRIPLSTAPGNRVESLFKTCSSNTIIRNRVLFLHKQETVQTEDERNPYGSTIAKLLVNYPAGSAGFCGHLKIACNIFKVTAYKLYSKKGSELHDSLCAKNSFTGGNELLYLFTQAKKNGANIPNDVEYMLVVDATEVLSTQTVHELKKQFGQAIAELIKSKQLSETDLRYLPLISFAYKKDNDLTLSGPSSAESMHGLYKNASTPAGFFGTPRSSSQASSQHGTTNISSQTAILGAPSSSQAAASQTRAGNSTNTDPNRQRSVAIFFGKK
ncbi:MAG: hypothetical protein JSS53_04075 [Proteobacteria bacterium]|nr:hypothetical protein [Pseudomonadota bacterium]